ncbi:DNA processing protein [Sphingomonas vulcanisoli]|uniref:DNA processing protein n=1 Tax=Sphingomonas vulcanisoli TaxID=1658060 RepID=A0ABX0TRS6_9SPHN|nr:DNA-processing protein DprA [Sphingomonas vulcanisoli]NIJ08229.1 DNA processing protein [Sphingomonas vulcanisoli]
MIDAGDIAKLRLIRTRSIGPISYRQLLLRFGSAQAALDALPALARRGGGAAPVIATPASIECEAERVFALGARYLFLDTPGFPPALAEIENAPPALIVAGDVALLGKAMVAMVGARNASAAAVRFTRQLAADLGAEGRVIVSGLARGIDTAAHVGSLETGTIGVIAGGIDVFYPPENEKLQRAIAGRGLLIAEMPPGTEPRARHFPYRNRIIAGLAEGTVVMEAAPKSGSLITARLATEMGREVMAVPGSPLDPRAQGCNLLIREGATLIQNAADVIESLTPIAGFRLAEPVPRYEAIAEDASDADRARVSGLLSPSPTMIDEIIRQGEMPAAVVQTVLLELELAGRLERHAGGRVSLIL